MDNRLNSKEEELKTFKKEREVLIKCNKVGYQRIYPHRENGPKDNRSIIIKFWLRGAWEELNRMNKLPWMLYNSESWGMIWFSRSKDPNFLQTLVKEFHLIASKDYVFGEEDAIKEAWNSKRFLKRIENGFIKFKKHYWLKGLIFIKKTYRI